MLNPDDLIKAWVAKLQDIPALVAVFIDPSNITGYFDQFPSQSNLRVALMQQPPGSILVVFIGTDKARVGTAFQFRHRFSFQVRAPEANTDGVSYGGIWSLFVNGAPATGNPGALPLLHFPIHNSCYPMDLEFPAAQRSTILVSVDGATLDLFEIQASLIEVGN